MAGAKRTLLAFSKDQVDTYKLLGEQLGEARNRDQFLIAMTWGFRYGVRVEEFARANTGPRLEYLKPEDHALMAAIQLAVTGDPQSLLDIEQRHMIAEQYAEGGIRLLGDMLTEPGDFGKSFAGTVRTELGRLGVTE